MPSSLQNDSIHLDSVTEKPVFTHTNNSSIIESSQFGTNTFKPTTTPEKEKLTIAEETTTDNKASVCIDEDNPTATDYASEC